MSSASVIRGARTEYVPDKQWMDYTHECLPGHRNNFITDVDTVIRSREGCVCLVEVKRRNSKPKDCQKITYGILAAALKMAEGQFLTHPLIGYTIKLEKFFGVYTIVFENTFFDDGKTYLSIDGGEYREVTKEELTTILKFDDYCEDCYDKKDCACTCQYR